MWLGIEALSDGGVFLRDRIALLRRLLPSARAVRPIRACERVGLAWRYPDMRDAYGDPGMARLRPNLWRCHPDSTKRNAAYQRGGPVNNIHERDAALYGRAVTQRIR